MPAPTIAASDGKRFQETDGKTQLIEIPCGQNGFAVPTFNNALDYIMGEAYMVQGNSDE